MSNGKQLTPVDSLKQSIKLLEPQFKMALPSHVSVDKFVRTVMTAVQQTPALVNADRTSLFAACMKSASSGLLPNGSESALVLFGDKVQFMPMIAGQLRLVRNSGELLSITAQIIHEKDVFKYWVDTDGEHLSHEPNMLSDRGPVMGAYALAKTKDNAVYIEVMTLAEINDVKNVSRSKDKGPWAGPFKLEMYKKTVLRRLIKRLPVSTDLDGAIKADDETYDISDVVTQPDPEPQEKPVSSSRLEKLIQVDPDVRPEPITTTVVKPFNHAPGADNSGREVPI